MKKVGAITAAIGFLLALGLFFVRRSDWFARQMQRSISEFGELAEAGFWAALIMTVLGGILLLIGLRRTSRVRDEIDAPAPLSDEWVCAFCGTLNRGGDVCGVCGGARHPPAPPWVCPSCGQSNPDTADRCQSCGRNRPGGGVWVCPWCGSPVDDEFTACTICGARREG